ncbi:MAG: thioredoxin [Actinomycetota bacterium]|nr:thioredoxin [Actinomycetota bacterium]
MATVQVTSDNFSDVVSDTGTVVLDFWASWCGPCRSFAPVFEKVSEQHPDIVFGKVDTEDQPEVAAGFEVRSIPTVVVIRDGVVLYAEPGALPERAFTDLVGQARDADMDEMRQRMQASG